MAYTEGRTPKDRRNSYQLTMPTTEASLHCLSVSGIPLNSESSFLSQRQWVRGEKRLVMANSLQEQKLTQGILIKTQGICAGPNSKGPKLSGEF